MHKCAISGSRGGEGRQVLPYPIEYLVPSCEKAPVEAYPLIPLGLQALTAPLSDLSHLIGLINHT